MLLIRRQNFVATNLSDEIFAFHVEVTYLPDEKESAVYTCRM